MSLLLDRRQLIESKPNRLLSLEGLRLMIDTLELTLSFSSIPLEFFKGISGRSSAFLFAFLAEVAESVESEFKLVKVSLAVYVNISF